MQLFHRYQRVGIAAVADEGHPVDGNFGYFGVEVVGLHGFYLLFAQRTGGDDEFYAVVEELVESFNFAGVDGYDVGFGVEPFKDFDLLFDDGFEGLIDADGDSVQNSIREALEEKIEKAEVDVIAAKKKYDSLFHDCYPFINRYPRRMA